MKPSGGRAANFFCQKISSRMAEADSVCQKIRTLLQNNTVRQVCFAVELLARECVNNAVIHGNRNNANKAVTVRLWVGREWIRLQVGDEGSGFAWRQTCRKRLDATATYGRGLQLYGLYAERIRFNRCGNQITLWIRKKGPIRKGPIRKEDGNGCIRH